MKISIAALSFVSAASATSFRGQADKHSVLTTNVQLKGVSGKASDSDMEFIGKALVASYNDVHWEAGHFLGQHETIDVFPICRYCPDDDASMNEKGTFAVKSPIIITPICRYCPDDDASLASSLLTTAVTDDCAGLCNKQAAAELEVSFCNKIMNSGSEYLKAATSCSLDFEGEEKKAKKHALASAEPAATLDSTLVLKGVQAGDVTKDELALIAKAYVSAYNDVNFESGHYMSDAEIPFNTPTTNYPICRYCPDDDSMGGATTLVLDVVTPVVFPICRYCPDDDASANLADIKSTEQSRKALEVAFCKKIQSSVSNKLRATQSCALVMETIIDAGSKQASA